MKILSNKKYNELILKSCKEMFGAVTDDMLLRNNSLLNEENKQLKEKLDKYKDIIDRFEHWLMLEVEIKCKNEYVVPFKIALEKIQKIEKSDSNEYRSNK